MDLSQIQLALGEYPFQFGLAVFVLTAAATAWIVSRRSYVKSAEFKRGIDALKLESRRSIDEVHAATTRKATAINQRLLAAIKPIDSTVADLNVRLARLEEHADAVETFMAGPQKQALEENERTDARLTKLEQKLKALNDQLSSLQQTIDGAIVRDQQRHDLIEVINSHLMNTQKQVDELLPRLELGEKARTDLGSVISLFVKQLKRVNINSAETALHVADLESLRPKVTRLEKRLSSILERETDRSTGLATGNISDSVEDATLKADDGAGSIETNNGSDNASVFAEPPTSTEQASSGPSLEGESLSEHGSSRGRMPSPTNS